MRRLTRPFGVIHQRILLCVAMIAASALLARGQFPENGGLYNQELKKQNEYLDFILQNHPDLENIFFPNKYMIPKDFYADKPTTDYLMTVTFDPCRGHDYNCCNDTYGTPEWRTIDDVPTSPTFGGDILTTETGAVLSSDARCDSLSCLSDC
jgi:hypothetical protein